MSPGDAPPGVSISGDSHVMRLWPKTTLQRAARQRSCEMRRPAEMADTTELRGRPWSHGIALLAAPLILRPGNVYFRDECHAERTSCSRSGARPAPFSICVRAASGAALNHVSASTADVANGRNVRPAATARAFATCVLA